MTARLRDPEWGICASCGGEDEAHNQAGGKRYCALCWPVVQECRATILGQSHYDQIARDYAGQIGGAYLEKIGKTDIATLTPSEWSRFLDTLFRAKQSELRRLHSPGSPLL